MFPSPGAGRPETIDPLRSVDCRDAFLRIQHPLRIELDFDQSKIRYLLRTQHRLCRSSAHQDDHVRVRELVTHQLLCCASLDMLGGDLDRRFALELADIWLSRNGYLMLSSEQELVQLLKDLSRVPRFPRQPLPGHVEVVRSWVGSSIAEVASGRTLAEKSGAVGSRRPLQSFIACPLTAVSPDELRVVRKFCGVVASVMGEFGILTMQPALYTAPGVTPMEIDSPVYRSIDERLIAESDIVLVMATRPSFGLGAIATIANRYRKHLLFASPGGPVSPMIKGLDPAPTILELRVVDSALRHHLDAALPGITEESERGRQELVEIAAELAHLRELLGNRSTAVPDKRRGMTMSRERFRELLGSPELFAGATVLERRELYRLARNDEKAATNDDHKA